MIFSSVDKIGNESSNNLPPEAFHLFNTNTSVNVHYESVHNVLTTEECKFTAIDSLVGDTGSELTDKYKYECVVVHIEPSLPRNAI